MPNRRSPTAGVERCWIIPEELREVLPSIEQLEAALDEMAPGVIGDDSIGGAAQ